MFHALLSGFSAVPAGAAAQGSAWLLTYLVHSTLFLGLAWLLARGPLRRRPALEETVWRFALVAALVTASVQTVSERTPLAGRLGVTERRPAPAAAVLPLPTELAVVSEAAAPLRSVRLSAAPPSQAVAPSSAAALPWTTLLAGLWAAGALALGARWLAAHLLLHRRLRARPEIVGGDMYRVLRRLLAAADLPEPVRLTVSWRLPVPVALGLHRREICVPPRAVAALASEEQEGLLAHELAHLVRHDPFWLALSQFLASVLFLQPLNLVARRRLRELSELRSDEWAVGKTGSPLSLARCLTEVAGWSFRPLGTLVAPGMADRPSHLAKRVRRLLEGARSPEHRVRPLWLAAAFAVLLIAVAAAAPGFSATDTSDHPGPVAAGPQGAGPDGAPPAGSPPAGPAPQLAPPAGSGPAGAPPHGEGPREKSPAAHGARHGDPDDTDLDVDLDLDIHPDIDLNLDVDIDRNLEAALAGLDALSGPAVEGALAGLSSLGEQHELTAEEEKALEQKLDAMNDELENRLKPQLEEMERKLEKEMEGLEHSPAMEKLHAQTEEISRRMQPSGAEMEALHAKIEAMKADGLSSEERTRIREEARALAGKYRMSEQQRTEMRELARKVRDEQQRFMKEHGAEIEAMRKAIQEQAAAMREEIHRRLEADPQLRALRDKHRQEIQQHRDEMRKHREEMRKDREKMREDQREQRKEHSIQREHAHPKPEPHPHPHPAGHAVEGGIPGGIRGGVPGGIAGGIPGGVRGGVPGGVEGGVPGGVNG